MFSLVKVEMNEMMVLVYVQRLATAVVWVYVQRWATAVVLVMMGKMEPTQVKSGIQSELTGVYHLDKQQVVQEQMFLMILATRFVVGQDGNTYVLCSYN